jgi:hypothetical protein
VQPAPARTASGLRRVRSTVAADNPYVLWQVRAGDDDFADLMSARTDNQRSADPPFPAFTARVGEGKRRAFSINIVQTQRDQIFGRGAVLPFTLQCRNCHMLSCFSIPVAVATLRIPADVIKPIQTRSRYPRRIHLFDSAKLADLVGDWSDARWKASLKLGSSDHVEQGADRDERHLFMAEEQKR